MPFDWWSFALQLINFLILAWLLQRFLYRPVMGIVAARREAADKLLAEAASARQAAASLEADLTARRQAAGRESDAILAEARQAAEAERQAAIEQAKTQSARLLADAQATIRRETSEAASRLQGQAAELAAAMTARLVREAPVSLSPFLDRLVAELQGLPAPIAAALRTGPLEVVTASPLSPEAATECATRIGAVLGQMPAPRFRNDTALLAGLELRAPQAVLRSNWAADLARLSASLTREEQDDGVVATPG